MYTVQISEDLNKRLVELAKQTNRSENAYVEEAVAQFLEDKEDYDLAMKAIAKGGPTISLDALAAELGIVLDR
jgi:RHH-type rel operon transcriptional repressor/antitoxin RelB